MENKFGAITIILIILLIMRLIGQLVNAFSFPDMVHLVIYSILAIVYLVALIGVFIKQKWGSSLVMIIAAIDILFAVIIGGTTTLLVIPVDLILILLGNKEHKQISS